MFTDHLSLITVYQKFMAVNACLLQTQLLTMTQKICTVETQHFPINASKRSVPVQGLATVKGKQVQHPHPQTLE